MITKRYHKYVIPNALTVLRLFLIPVFLVFCYRGMTFDFPLVFLAVVSALLIFIIIRITDILDGWIARTTNSTSVIGGYLDVWIDFLFVLGSFILLNYLNVLPAWITALVIYKFFEFLISSEIVKRYLSGCTSTDRPILYYDIPGRVASTFFYLLPNAILIIKLLGIDLGVIDFLSAALVLVTVLSSVLRYLNIKNVIASKGQELRSSSHCKRSKLHNTI